MSILPEKLEAYRKFFSFMIKYRNSDIFNSTKDVLAGVDIEDEKGNGHSKPKEFAQDLQNMGPTYIKFGQLLSTRPDLLPDQYLDVLKELQDDVTPIDFETITEVFEKEIGVRISKAFKFFEETPLASASIGQVHKAVLHSGIEVAVKIQRPNIREEFLTDLETLKGIADFAVSNSKEARKYNISEVVDELRYTLLQELDYKVEAENLLTLKENLHEFTHLYVPKPILDYCSSRVLTMEFIEGKKVTSVAPLAQLENDFTPIVDDLIEGYLKQVIVDGFAHADPHPGNVHLQNNKRIALMDLGMVAKFSPALQENILKLMISLSHYNGSEIAETLLQMSDYDNEANIRVFKKNINRLVMETQNKKATDMPTGRLLIHMNRIAAQNGIQIPVELNTLGKILLNMDQIVAVLTPDYDVQRTIKRYVEKLMQAKMVNELKPENTFNLLLEAKQLAEKSPARLNKILERLSKNEFEIKIDAIDEKRFTDAFQKVANRITVGIIIAAMIVGAALLIQIPTEWKIFGYPGLAIILFIIAACLGFYLVYLILVNDENFNKHKE